MKNGIKGKQSIPAVITIEFRVTKRNQMADLIQGNQILKELSEQTIMEKVKDIENNIYSENQSNVHLYSRKIEKVIALFKGINQNNYIYIAQKLKKHELSIKSITKMSEKLKVIKDYEQKLRSKQNNVKQTKYDPLNTKPIVQKVQTNPLIESKVTLLKIKPKQQISFGSTKSFLVFADPFDIKDQPEKKLKINDKQSDDEIDIRINDGMQGAAFLIVFCSKLIYLQEGKLKIPIYLLIDQLPQYKIICEKIEFTKLYNAKETISFLQINQERKIVFGQILIKSQNQYLKQLNDISQRLQKNDKIIVQKYDQDNATFVILHKQQLEQILKARKLTISFDASDMIIKNWAKDQSYLEWWALNKQNHDLYFLIYYKNQQSNSSDHIFDRITLQKPSCYPEIKEIINEHQNKKEINDLLEGFLQYDLQPLENIMNENQLPLIQELKPTSPVKLKEYEESKNEKIEQQIPIIKLLDKIQSLDKQYYLDIRNLALQLSKDDYF